MTDESIVIRPHEDKLKEATIVVIPVSNKFRVLRYTVWDPGDRVDTDGLACGHRIVFDTEESALSEAKKWAEEIHEATGVYIEVLETVISEAFGEREAASD